MATAEERENADRDGFYARASWGAAVLRPYMTLAALDLKPIWRAIGWKLVGIGQVAAGWGGW